MLHYFETVFKQRSKGCLLITVDTRPNLQIKKIESSDKKMEVLVFFQGSIRESEKYWRKNYGEYCSQTNDGKLLSFWFIIIIITSVFIDWCAPMRAKQSQVSTLRLGRPEGNKASAPHIMTEELKMLKRCVDARVRD